MELSSKTRKLLEDTIIRIIKSAKMEDIQGMSCDELITILLIETYNKKSQTNSGDGMVINF